MFYAFSGGLNSALHYGDQQFPKGTKIGKKMSTMEARWSLLIWDFRVMPRIVLVRFCAFRAEGPKSAPYCGEYGDTQKTEIGKNGHILPGAGRCCYGFSDLRQ